ncbi:MAG: enoyl-CoA hydratase-related protein [Candidatus Rokubacteria bacterium]|nr:enoyl-CoA hydratase-related protein [Candidatus Rokubacteria bacterium]
MTDVVLVAQADGVLTLTLNRPDSLNALTVEVMGALADRLEAAAADRSARAVVITGAGSAFSAGGDLAFLQELPGMPPARAKEVVYGNFQRVPRLIRGMDKPVIAAVNGAAVGAGCEIAVACDFRIASEKARFGEVWITLGCIPALGGMYLLPRLVGFARATELVLTGEIIDAREALRIGLVNKVVMPPDLPRAAEELARSLARGPARAIAAAKEALNRGLASTFWAELDATVDAQVACFGTRDFAEGVRALVEKRPPRFTGD